MKFATIPSADAALSLFLLLAPLPANAMLRCNHIVSGDQRYDLEKLGGPHSVVMSHAIDNETWNTTYTVDICRPLKKKGNVKKQEQCPNGSRVCAIQRHLVTGGDKDMDDLVKAIPLAGELDMVGGNPLDPEVKQLSEIDPSSGNEGLRIIMKGGFDRTTSGVKRKQQVLLDFVCDKDRDGTEGEWTPEDQYEPSTGPIERREDGEDGDGDGEDGDGDEDDTAPPKDVQLGIANDPSLVFQRYGPSDSNNDVDVLHMVWRSKYVCTSKADDGTDEGHDDNGDGGEKKPKSSGWGFFTWLVILVFLGTAAYLIFGSWLNYNRYGARGWDLLPHGDTIRDVPYLLKDWVRRVLNTVQGSGSRGGYSAV
ncbi:autophagy-related protein 27 [Xylariaceae sp. FL0255]|nr:autophagy-related protein 27 [Xylariaceae sp. FL0255]